MSISDLKVPSSTLAELRGVLVRALSRENLSMSDKLAIRKSESSSSLKINCTWSSSYGGKQNAFSRSQPKVLQRINRDLCCQRVVSVCVQPKISQNQIFVTQHIFIHNRGKNVC